MVFLKKQLKKHSFGWNIRVLLTDILLHSSQQVIWRDEQWVTGYGLFVNTLVYSYLRLFGQNEGQTGCARR